MSKKIKRVKIKPKKKIQPIQKKAKTVKKAVLKTKKKTPVTPVKAKIQISKQEKKFLANPSRKLNATLYNYVEKKNAEHAKKVGKLLFGSHSAYVNALIAKDRGAKPNTGLRQPKI